MSRPIIIFLIIFARLTLVRSDCIVSGVCGPHVTISSQPPIRGEEITEESLKILQEICPEYYRDGKNGTRVCCTSEQLVVINGKFQRAVAAFGRCPTCTKNILKSICAITCSPDQDKFLKIAEKTEDGKCAKTVALHLDYEYMRKTYESCKGIILSLTGGPVMETACGDENSFTCTPEKWFAYMGRYDDYQINYVISHDKRRRFEFPVKRCNESYENSFACSCVDCQITCNNEISEKIEPEMDFMQQTTYILLVVIIFTGIIPAILYFMSRSSIGKMKGIPLIDVFLKHFFTKWGETVAKNPVKVLFLFILVVIPLSIGAMFIEVTTDPVKLWAAHDSQARQQKEYFDATFGPFFRTEQIFVKPIFKQNFTQFDSRTGQNITYGPAFNVTFLKEVQKFQQEILSLGQAEGEGLEKICYAPIMEANVTVQLENCVVQSLFGYLSDDETLDDDYDFQEGFFSCIRNPFHQDCLSSWGGPAIPELVLGGYPKAKSKNSPPEYNLATLLSITIIVKNYKDPELLHPAMKWEEKFIKFLSNYKNPHFKVVFKAERSIEDGIQEMSNAEFLTVIVSYSLMFLYIVFSLGRIRNLNSFFMESKITLAAGGIIIVMASVLCSLGVFGYTGVSTTMLTIEVIPFLVLAVGVDNIFILVQTFNRLDKETFKDIPTGLGVALGEVGPSLLLTAATECFCFSIGSLSNMPAVKTFAYFATVAILLDFLFQITAFLALIALDERRFRAQRFDVMCCCQSKLQKNVVKSGRGVIEKMFDLFFTPLLMSKPIQVTAMGTMLLWTAFSIFVTPLVEPGLEQSITMPKDSYIAEYFSYLERYLDVGPPVYFVLKPGLDFRRESDQNLICGGLKCNSNSLIGQINAAVRDSERSKIAKISNSWLDDYFDWIKSSDCCKETPSGDFCSSNSDDSTCKKCVKKLSKNGIRPTAETFDKFFPLFLADLPGDSCFKGGKAVYADGIIYDPKSEPKIKDSYFMTYHTPLKNSRDFYTALIQARKIAANMNEMFKQNAKNVEVFPYSVFYVFYEQYLTMWKDVAISLGLSLLTVFVTTLTVTGFDLISALMVVYMVGLILINMLGLMWMFNISLNAISLVNLVVCVGIGVEFVSHIVWSYTQTSGSRRERASYTLTKTGSSVLSGIALTKFSGIVVLAFAKSQIFRVFYFQMYLGMVLIGAVHGLIFLPILLCYFGPNSKQTEPRNDTSSSSEETSNL
ncbi:NPC intracellular cholesterol transporter 1 homolog 1b-like [Culicoides brevitarsis]|uniref:NPC intracellular cholesterol transporter 1 homolog 1b-like n=1 Tax=Culicoides brevitarsis TaxID=469753 RepID=UPI00307C5A9E